ncbi:MAG: hypothetical protein Q9217_000173 [Psora testacea]
MATLGATSGQAQSDSEKIEANRVNGLATPEPTPGPDEARNQADEQRRQAESSEATKPSAQTNNTAAATPSSHKSQSKSTPQGRVGKKRAAPNDKQKGLAVTNVLKCDATAYSEILGVKSDSSKDDVLNAYMRLAILTNPKNNTNKGSSEAYNRVMEAGKKLGLDGKEVNEQEVDFEEMDSETTDSVNTLPREDFLRSIYDQAGPHLNSLMENLDGTEAKNELAKLNDSIEKRNANDSSAVPESDRTKAFIDVPTFVGKFQSAKPFRDRLEKNPADAAASQEFNKINESLKAFNQEHGYPPTWIMNKPGPAQETGTSATNNAKSWQPGLTRKLEKILGCREILGGHRYYVETVVNGLATCEVRTADEIGVSASNAYLKWDEKVIVGENARKYRKKDFESYGGIVHVACKPVHTRTLPKDKDRKPRRPLTDVFALVKGAKTWITYSDLTNMCGKGDAEADTEGYYDERGLTYPWDVPPKRVIKVIEQGRDDTVDSDPASGDSAGQFNTPSEDSGTQSSMDQEIAQLKEQNANFAKQMAEMMEMMKSLKAASAQSAA